MQKLAISLKSIKDELQEWHDESKRNQTSIAALNKRLELLSQKTAIPPELQQEIAGLATKVQQMAAKKPTMPPETKAELARLQAQMETLAKLPLSQAAPEARAAIEEQLSKLQTEKERIIELQKKLEELSASSDSTDQRHDEELTSLKEEVKAAPRKMAAETKEGEEFLRTLKTELEAWHKESMSNAKELNALLKRVAAIESQAQVGEKLKKEMERTMGQMGQVAGSIDKFEELKKTIVKHNEEFEDLYSAVGKERVELNTLNESVLGLQTKLVEWGERNTENLQEVHDIRTDLAALAKEIKSRDFGKRIDEFSGTMGMLADRVESLQRQERDLLETQQQLVEFDRGMKELVRKAVLATLSRQDFEKEFEQLEGKAAKPRRAAAPAQKDVRTKMLELRKALKGGEADKAVLDTFTGFEKKLNTAASPEDAKALWQKLGKDVADFLKDTLASAKSKITTGKAAGQDVSALNLLVAKTDIGLVSLETSVSLQNLAKTKEIIQKLGQLKSQLEAGL